MSLTGKTPLKTTVAVNDGLTPENPGNAAVHNQTRDRINDLDNAAAELAGEIIDGLNGAQLAALEAVAARDQAIAIADPTSAVETVLGIKLPPAVAEYVLASGPAISQAAATLAQSDAGLVRTTDVRLPDVTSASSGILVAITDKQGNRTWLEAAADGGGPTAEAGAHLTKAVRDQANAQGSVLGVLVAVTDALGNRTWLEAASSDGGLTDYAAGHVRTGLDRQALSLYVADGDSMLAYGPDAGGNTGTMLGALLPAPLVNLARSGSTWPEMAMRAGGLVALLTIPGGQVPADTTAVTVTVNLAGPFSVNSQVDRLTDVTVRGIPCTLTYVSSAGTWTLARKTAGTALPVGSPIAAVPVEPYPVAVHVLWGGRNDIRAAPDLTVNTAAAFSTAARIRETGGKFILVSVCNASTEPSGSAGYNKVAAANLAYLTAYPREYVDLRGRMIREGLGLAGLTATTEDNTAIAEDRIPPQLFLSGDTVHFNAQGRTAAAAILKDALTTRGLA